jgi:polyisoprenyl-teichoic acid--peptidoglycan teichoic acid transferase
LPAVPLARRRHWPRYVAALSAVGTLTAGAVAYVALASIPPTAALPCGAECVDPPEPPGKPQTLLLIGSDQRVARSSDGDIGRRSDTVMLARIGGGQATTLLSIPRDTAVTIPLKGGGSRTGKINEAFGEGGAALTAKVVRQLLGVKINQVAVVHFEAFQRAVNRVGCLYQDIDRSYFNNRTGPGGYAAINVQSGYQLLCGGDTLDWVRYRHTDSDLVRGTRQQAFLRSAKGQVAASKLIDDRTELIRLFQRYVQTSITSRAQMVGLIKLALGAAGEGTRSVPFIAQDSADPGNTDLVVTPAAVTKMRTAFLRSAPSQRPAAPRRAASERPRTAPRSSRAASSMVLAPGLARVDEPTFQPLAEASFELAARRLPVYAPTVRLATGGWADRDPVRAYAIKAGRYSARTYPAFRLAFAAGDGPLVGQYYGVQGTTWKRAPILRGTHHAVRRRGRTLQVYLAGSRAQLVAWHTPSAVYWVSNTLSQSLTTRQLVDIAASLRRIPG